MQHTKHICSLGAIYIMHYSFLLCSLTVCVWEKPCSLTVCVWEKLTTGRQVIWGTSGT